MYAQGSSATATLQHDCLAFDCIVCCRMGLFDASGFVVMLDCECEVFGCLWYEKHLLLCGHHYMNP